MKVVASFDGGMQRSNPGPAGYGYIVVSRTGRKLDEGFGHIGVATNNEAEYWGLIAALTAAAGVGATEVEIRTDSQLVARQMTGEYRVTKAHIRELWNEAQRRAKTFQRVTYVWGPREENVTADRLAKKGAWDVPDAACRIIVTPVRRGNK